MAEKAKVEVINAVNVVGFILIAMAGWVDIVGLKLFFNQRSAFMTGRASLLGEKLATPGGMSEAIFIIIVVVSFIIGAGISAKITKASGLIGGLVFSGVVVIITAVLFGSASPGAAMVKEFSGTTETLRLMTGILLPMAMGGLNAATSLTNINRTTHLTGPATDIGINLFTGNMSMAVFWILRWIGFPAGAFLAVGVVGGMSPMMALLIPGVVIALTGIVQKMTVDIPLK
ncbi:MAG: DUF1275 family protein [Actinomycetota bacterium]|nr:DUF1275 family protein [Actinomycetota bacterium]